MRHLWFVVLVLHPILSNAGEHSVNDANWICKATEAKGLVLKVSIRQGVDWKHVIALLDVTNISEKEITYGYSSALRGFKVTMSKDSKEVRRTQDGELFQKTSEGDDTKYISEDLRPGKTLTVKIEISALFLPDEPGNYELVVSWEQDRLSKKAVKLELRGIAFATGGLQGK